MFEKFFPKKWHRVAVSVAATIIAVYAIVYIDVVARARHAYMEGEKYWQWHEQPSLKAAFFDEKLVNEKTQLKKRLDKGKISADEYDVRVEIIEAGNQREREESSIKYAYVWYKTAVELFSPPESKWVKLSRQKMPLAKDLWRKELKAKKIPFEEYMLD
ncbi:MAG: hypothetical protein CVU77_03825 [Elusimicrobia bacterium HGW-Elusimicrobia-1]|jgi:hypothetical protein|nr:MAG: hypothetical protein CVU77_03825 [Elusimicrobia bacterium HGW-Elusimicrobia-1]